MINNLQWGHFSGEMKETNDLFIDLGLLCLFCSQELPCPRSHTQRGLRIRMLLIFSSLLALFPFFFPTVPPSFRGPSFPTFCHRCVLTACFGLAPLGILLLFLQPISDVRNLHAEGESSSLCIWHFWTLEDWAVALAPQRSPDPTWKKLDCPQRSRLDRLSATGLTGGVKSQSVLQQLVIVFRILQRLHGNEISFSTYNLLYLMFILQKKKKKWERKNKKFRNFYPVWRRVRTF